MFIKSDFQTEIIGQNKLLGLSPQANYTDHCLLAKLVPTFVDRGCFVFSTADLHGRILGFLDRSHYYFFQVAPRLYSKLSGPCCRPSTSQKI
jgi:hypothetical protein